MHKVIKEEKITDIKPGITMSFIGTIEYFTPGEDFTEYQERLNHLLKINKVTDDKTKVSYLITLIGPEAYKILKSLTAPASPDTKEFAELIEIFNKYFKPKTNTIAERFKFYKRNQNINETINDYIVELKTLSKTCDFKEFLDDALRDKLVCGVKNEAIQQRLLNEIDLKFDKACELATGMELTRSAQLKIMRPDSDNNIGNVKFENCNGRRNYQQPVQQNNRTRNYNASDSRINRSLNSNNRNGNQTYSNNRNGNNNGNHGNNWHNITCRRCGKKGHIQKNCFVKLAVKNKGQVNNLELVNTDIGNLSLGYLNNITSKSDLPARISLNINKIDVVMEIDSGACGSVIDIVLFKQLFDNIKIIPVNKSLEVITGNTVKVVGAATVSVRDVFNLNKMHNLQLIIIETSKNFVPLLGRAWLDVLFIGWRDFFH